MTQQSKDKLSFLDNLAPSDDFGLQLFLGKLDESLTDEEFEKLKFYCAGKHGIAKSVLEKIKRPLDLFTKLKERGNLSNENLLTLQSMLWYLPRKDLQRQCADFAKSLGDALHFVVPNEKPVNGYKYVKFHVKGKDLDTYNRSDLEQLRNVVAQRILMVPPEFVYISGIEPDKSLSITFMIPADYVDQLLQITNEEKQTLLNISVNSFSIEDVKITLSVEADKTSSKKSAMDEETRRKLYLLKQREDELETLQLHKIGLENSLTDLKYLNTSLVTNICLVTVGAGNIIDFLSKQIYESEREGSGLAYLSALSYFKHALGKVRQKKYDADTISNLLDAQCLLNQQRWKQSLRLTELSLQFTVEQLRTANITLQYERDKLAYYHGIGKNDKVMSERDEYYVSLISKRIPLSPLLTSVNIGLTKECVNYIIENLAKDIKSDEIKDLLQRSNLTKNEKSSIGKSALKLLRMLTEKHQKSGVFNFSQFVIETLRRPDLIAAMHKYIQDFNTKEQERLMRERGSQPDAHKKRSHSSGGIPNVNVETKLDEILERMNKMDERQQKMEENFCPSSLNGSFTKDPNWINKADMMAKLMWTPPKNIQSHVF